MNQTKSRKQRAAEVRQALWGEAAVPLRDTDPELAALRDLLIYGELYPRCPLPPRLRELVLLAVSAALQTPDLLRRHTAAALSQGAAPEEIREAVYHTAPYIGIGRTEAAVRAMNEVFLAAGISLPLPEGGTVPEERRLPEGIAAQKAIFADAIDAMRQNAPEDEGPLQDYLSAYCFGDFYTRKFLSLPERELLTFTVLAALGGCEAQVNAHIRGNAAVGNGRETLLSALMASFPYIGFPRTLNALGCLDKILPGTRPET